MNSMKGKFVVLLLLAGLRSACGSQPTNTPASPPPTNSVTAATQVPATAPAAATDPSTQAPAAGTPVSFASAVLPLLQSRCVNCHGGQRTEKGLNLNSYDSIMAGSQNGPVVTAGDAASSPLAQMVVNGKMPKRGPKLTPAEVQLI